MGWAQRADADGIVPVTIGTVLWIIVLTVLVIMRDSLAIDGRSWWIGAAAVGVASGALGLVFLRWRRGRRR